MKDAEKIGQVNPLKIEEPFVEIYLDETIHDFKKTDEGYFAAYYSHAVKCKDCGLEGVKARFHNFVIVNKQSVGFKNCNGKKVVKKIEEVEENHIHRPCYICEKTKNGQWHHVKVGKRTHLICSECYLKNLKEIKETGGIARRKKEEDFMAKKGKKAKQNGGKKGSARPTIMGFSPTSVLKWLGAKGVKLPEARNLIAKLGVPVSQASIGIFLSAGRLKQRGDPAPLTAEQGAKLLAMIPKTTEKKKDNGKKAEKKAPVKKTAKKKKK